LAFWRLTALRFDWFAACFGTPSHCLAFGLKRTHGIRSDCVSGRGSDRLSNVRFGSDRRALHGLAWRPRRLDE
jgi:hypothetical protein